jgi:STE24 endopeptidase
MLLSSWSWTLLFAVALLAGLAVKFWLATRQVRHVARHRDAVPADFASTVTLGAHQKAADYTVAKARVGLVEMAFGAAVLLGWTLLGGLDALNQALLAWLGPGMLQQLALLGCFAVIGGLLDLPFTLYSTFVVEERFGFNKMTWRLWMADMAKGLLLGALIGVPISWLILWLMCAAGRCGGCGPGVPGWRSTSCCWCSTPPSSRRCSTSSSRWKTRRCAPGSRP